MNNMLCSLDFSVVCLSYSSCLITDHMYLKSFSSVKLAALSLLTYLLTTVRKYTFVNVMSIQYHNVNYVNYIDRNHFI